MSGNNTSKIRRIANIVAGVITMIVLIALLAALMVLNGPKTWADKVAATDDAIDQTVSPTQSETYCPSPMGLADSGTYGDSAFQATVGNLSTQARFAAFGSVYSSTSSAFGQDVKADDVALKDGDTTDDASVKTGSQNIERGARLIDTHMLQAADGTGTTGTIASWADDGDLKGVSAASCVSTALSQSFLLSGTQTGTTQQLIVANPSTKPTTVDIAVWGTENSDEMTMSTQSSLSVPAEGEASLELAAAASNQGGLYVTVSSKETSIAAVVRTVSMDGLTSKGSDFAMPLGAASNASAAPSIIEGDMATAYLFAQSDTTAELSWITSGGLVHAKEVDINAGKVETVDLGEAPEDTLGVMSTAEDPVSFSVKATRSGDDGQVDFALVNAGVPALSSGLAVPGDVDAVVSLANTSNSDQTITLHSYDDKGAALKSEDVTLGANAARTIAAKDLSKDGAALAVLMVDDSSQKVSWGVRFSHKDLANGVVGLAAADATPLMPVTTHVWARNDASIVR
jgi:hypothetical protein